MAGAQCATFSFLAPLAHTKPKISLKPLLCHSISTSFTRKPTKRKNYLRPKILKTLIKPFPSTAPFLPPQHPTNPIIPTVPPENDVIFESPSDQIDKVEEFQISDSSGVAREYSDIVGKFSPNYVLKYGLYLAGFFVVQTIFAVWVLGNAHSEKKDDNLNSLDMGIDESSKGKLKFFLNKNQKTGSKLSNVIYLDEHLLEEKIKEIRTMAREARKIEEKKSKNSNEEDDIVDDILNSKGRIGIGKEIGTRLGSLEKRLNSKREKLPGSYMMYLDKFEGPDGEETDSLDVKEDSKTLMFKKKFRFKGPSMSSRRNVKGFPGREDGTVAKNKKSDLGGIDTTGRKEVVGEDDHLREGILGTKEMINGKKGLSRDLNSSLNDGKKFEKTQKEMGAGDPDKRFGAVQETRRGSPSDDNMMKFMKENREAIAKSDKLALLGRNGSSKHEVGNESPANKVGNKQSDTKTNLWWLNLPYVLAVLMRRGLDHEEPGGLFTLRINSQSQYQDETSYTVTFEDRADANNFCYLLESFFEDLGDFSADIVPLSTKELHEAVKSDGKKLIVVKKRKLKLYAGQPFEDVEMALHSLIEEDKTAYT